MTAVQRTSHKNEDPCVTLALGHHKISNVNPNFLVEKVPLLADLHMSFTQTGMTNSGWDRPPRTANKAPFIHKGPTLPGRPTKAL